VGTHALLTESTVFSHLGLVIADEQHRFGVAQRAKLAAKGADPHLLVMSATPIPGHWHC
jgi:ATP-dependent DNA helicase RecG